MSEYSNNRENYLKLWKEVQEEPQPDSATEEAAPVVEPSTEQAEAGFEEIAVKHELIEDMVEEATEESEEEVVAEEVLASEDAISFSNKIIKIFLRILVSWEEYLKLKFLTLILSLIFILTCLNTEHILA